MVSQSMVEYLLWLVRDDLKVCDKGILLSRNPEDYENRRALADATIEVLNNMKNTFKGFQG